MGDVRSLFGLALIVVQASLAIPLILALIRSKDRQGFSLPGEVIWVAAGGGWAVYGMMTGSVTLIVSGSIAALTSAVISMLVWPFVPSSQKLALILGSSTAIALVAGLLLNAVNGLSLCLAAIGVLQFMPQLGQSLRDLRLGAHIEGVSLLGAGMRSLYTLSWAIYGGAWFLWGTSMPRVDWPLVTWGLAGACAFALQSLVAFRSRKAPMPAQVIPESGLGLSPLRPVRPSAPDKDRV